MGKLGRLGLEPAAALRTRSVPGELIHIDVKKLGRISAAPAIASPGQAQRNGCHRPRRHARSTVGWDFVHVAIDDCTRLAYVEVLTDEKAITVDRVPTPRGRVLRAPRHHRRAAADRQRLGLPLTVHAIACRALGIRHLRTRPYRPQTNGKAERFIRTMLGGWAYGAIYRTSNERTAALDGWLWHYNHRRRHSALGHKPPIARLTRRNNLARDLHLASLAGGSAARSVDAARWR